MPSTRFGTDHERYVGSGIIALSELPDISEDDLIIHAKELSELQRQLKPRTWKPWQKEIHLKAEISFRHWKNRCIGKKQTLDGHDFPELRFTEDADIRMIENMALLQVVRSSKASRWEQRINNHERRWVVDFFWKDGSNNSEWAIETCHEAVCQMFSAPTSKLVTSNSAKNLPPAHICEDARLVRKTPGVVDAFRELSRLPSMWITKSFNFLTDVRKCFCNEEVQNYIQVIIHQWEKITLGWDDGVVPHVNVKSIDLLQSLAPRFSEDDQDFVERQFQQNSIFPGLKDPELRKKVEKAICRQGPILTLSTFAKDVRLLQSRVHEPMTKFLDTMDRENDTLRKRVVEILEYEFDEHSRSRNLPIALRGQKKETVERCYQHVFLHTIRNALSKGSVTQAQLSSFVKHELDSSFSAGTSCHSIESADVIATRAPTSSDMSEPEHINIKKRHGVDLFNEPAAVQHLYNHQIRESLTPRGGLSLSIMAQHIVRVFLFGETSVERVQVVPSSFPEQTVQPVQTVPAKLPFWASSPIGSCSTSDSTDSTDSTSVPSCLQVVHQPTPKDMHARKPFPAIERSIIGIEGIPDSHAASLNEAEPSPVPSSCPSRISSKRPLYNSTHDGVQHHDVLQTIKRPRTTGSEYGQVGEAQQWANTSPVWSQETAVPDAETHSGADPIVNDTRNVATTELLGQSPHIANSIRPNTYYPSRYSPGSSSRNETLVSMETYKEFAERNPFHVSERNAAQPVMPSGRNIQTPETVLQWLVRLPAQNPDLPDVQYKGSIPGMHYIAQADPRSTANFFANQMDLDEFSIFRYMCSERGRKFASSAKQLQHAIGKYRLKEVFVDSDTKQLASTDHRVTTI